MSNLALCTGLYFLIAVPLGILIGRMASIGDRCASPPPPKGADSAEE